MAKLTVPILVDWESIESYMAQNDIVHVVRCRDCKHRFVDGDNVRYNVCELNHNRVQSDDWFCADGERKDGDGDG